MPLQIPTREEIVNRTFLRMLGRDVSLSDLTLVAVVRILLEEMVVEEFLRLYAGLSRDQQQWFITTATAANLDRRLADFGLSRQPARAATGFVRISNTQDEAFTITPTTVYRTEPDVTGAIKRYRVLPNPDNPPTGVWESDAERVALVKVEAITAGPEGNTAAGTIVALENVSDPLQEVITNPWPIVNGRGIETDQEFRDRFRAYLDGLTRGTRSSIRFHLVNYVDATGNRPVKSVALVEWGGQVLLHSVSGAPVALQVYIEDGTGTASSGLVSEIQGLVDGLDTEADPGLRAAGAPAEVLAASPLPVNIDVRVIARSSVSPTEVRRLVEETVLSYIGQLPVAGQLITGELQGQVIRAQLFRRVMNVSGILEANILAPAGNVAVPIGRKAMPASVNVVVETT